MSYYMNGGYSQEEEGVGGWLPSPPPPQWNPDSEQYTAHTGVSNMPNIAHIKEGLTLHIYNVIYFQAYHACRIVYVTCMYTVETGC